jgi:transcriptional regulator with GAF, ATPase, and Fis domain
MMPRIVGISEPLRGTVWDIEVEEFTIGRDLSNCLSLDDPLLSRQHCVISNENGQFIIRDLGSHNRTFINDVIITEKGLENGDYIRVGNSIFRFLTDEGTDTSYSSEVLLDDDNRDWMSVSTVKLRVEDAVAMMARDLSVLLRISTNINSLRGAEPIQRELLRMIFEAIPAERGAILLVSQTPDDLSSVFGLGRDSEHFQPFRISRTVVQQVLKEGVGLLANRVSESGQFAVDSESLYDLKVRALLCAPLLLRGKVQGLIYLDTHDAGVQYGESHFTLLTAIAGIAALALDNARHISWLESENARLHNEIKIESNMIGSSQQMQEMHRLISKVAPSSSTVLIRGESGTGKELAARAIHQNSPRAKKPFVPINCATLSEQLLESELFGHEKGAFTGAITQKKGKLEAAAGGTVFLDEIGEMAPPLQAKLLRVLQDRKVERLGGLHPVTFDIRLIAATNRDLEAAIASGTFREDLYYRLNVVSFEMPRLKDRREDIPLLVDYFATKHSERCNRRVTGILTEALQCLMDYDWPGNVRELENAIERAVVLGSTDVIALDDLPEVVLSSRQLQDSSGFGLYKLLRKVKKELITKALEQASYNYVQAAAVLGIHPNNLHRLVRSMDLKVPPKTD